MSCRALSPICSAPDARATSRSTSPTPTTRSWPLSAAALRENDAASRRLREANEQALHERWGFAFEGRAFLLVPRERLGNLPSAAELLDVEPWDAALICVRPRPGAEALRLAEEKAALLSRERELEAGVLEAISAPLREALPDFLEQARAVEAFDLALAGARLARELGLSRPVLHDGAVRIEGGRHLPTEALCESIGTPYTPLDATFDAGPTVIFGSNMGGKTVVLKTVAFLQLAAQTGLFVPAAPLRRRASSAASTSSARGEAARRAGASRASGSRSGSSTRRTPTSGPKRSPSSTSSPGRRAPPRRKRSSRRSSRSSRRTAARSRSSPHTSAA